MLRSFFFRSRVTHLLSPFQTIFTRATDASSGAAQCVGVWTDGLSMRRWSSEGQGSNVKSTSEESGSAAGAESTQSASTDSDVATSEVESTLKEKEEELKDLQDKYLRALAETENVRQRMSKQVQDAKLFGIQGFAKDLLEVADILENAKNSISEEVLQSGDKPLLALVEGLKLTEGELQKVFKTNGLTKIDGKGEAFDPALHEAMFEVPGDNPGTVAVVSRYGYMLHGRTLRPARVGVVKANT